MAKYWIKLYIDTLDDPKIARLPDHLWRRQMELSILAGKHGDDGALPSVQDMAWKLHLPEEKMLEDLHSLEEAGLVYTCASTGETEPVEWVVTDFKERQTSESYERVKRYKQRYSNATSNGDSNDDSNGEYNEESNGDSNAEVAAAPSNSNSTSISNSDSNSLEEEGIQGEGEPSVLPTSPAEAMVNPDVRVFAQATGGRIPGLSQYRSVIEAVRFLRAREKLDDKALAKYLVPYWLAWSSRKRVDGRPYDPGNITWLVEWALNKSAPPPGAPKVAESMRPAAPSVEETRKMLDEKDKKLKAAVPPPEEVQAKMRGLGGKLTGKNAHSVGTSTHSTGTRSP